MAGAFTHSSREIPRASLPVFPRRNTGPLGEGVITGQHF